MGSSGGHPGTSSGILLVYWCFRRPPARENTCPKRYFTRFQRMFTSPWVCGSVSRRRRHVKTRLPKTIPSQVNVFSRRPAYLNIIPCLPASYTSVASLHVFRRSSSSAGVTRSVRDPPRCSSQLHGVSDQSREAVLQLCCKRAKLSLLRPFWRHSSRHVFSRMILPKGHQNARNDRYAKRRRLYRRHVKTRMTIMEARSMSRKPRKFTCLGSTLGQPRASWGLKRPQGKHVKTRVWDPSWAILGPPGASWRLLGAILVYLRASWGCPGASKGPRHVKTRVLHAIS